MMKKIIMMSLLSVLLLTACQKSEIEEKTTSNDQSPIVIDQTIEGIDSDKDHANEAIAAIDEVIVSESHEWTEKDQDALERFTATMRDLPLFEAKAFLDKEILDSSKLMADHYIAAYEAYLNDDLPVISGDFFIGSIQEDLVQAFNYGHFSREQLKTIEAKETIAFIEPLYDIGYKVETSEGMYYPIVDYNVLYQYEDKVTSGVQQYLRLMKRQSDIMAYSDAAIIVPWSEIGQRVLMSEALLSETLPQKMYERVQVEFKWGLQSFLFGTNNTPVFNYDDMMMTDPEILESFRSVADNGGLIVKNIMDETLKVLEEEDYKGTDRVYETINALIEANINW